MTDDPKYITGKMLIDGKLVEGSEGKWLETLNPADEMPIGRVPVASAADVHHAVTAAKRAQRDWALLDVHKRGQYLLKLADAIEARAEEIAQLETRDTGNTLNPMRGDVKAAVERIKLAVGLGYEVKGETIPASASGLHITQRVPYGVVGRIIPFNHPIGFAASRLASALISGNAIIIKPSEQSPLSACLLAELCADILPAGTVSILTGGGEVGEAIVRHPEIKRLAFIGSVETGMAIQQAAAEVAIKNVTLELGGKNPIIICPDADLDAAAVAAVRGMNFAWQGQSCGSTSRLMLHEDIYDTVLEKVMERIKAIKVGDPLNTDMNMGPMNSLQQLEKTRHYVAVALEGGATLLHGGHSPTGPEFERGYWFEPTVFGDVDMSMRIAKEEVFGPVLSVLRWKNQDEAIEMANAVDYGLTASIWTRNLPDALKFAREIEAGYLWINGVGSHFRNVPYGGFKNSGVGREEGLDEILSYTEVKTINFVVS